MNGYFKHEQAIVESEKIGHGTRIWAFAHILPHAQIGKDSNICDGVFIENEVLIGHGVTVKCGVQIWDGVTLEDNVFIGPNVTFTNDLFPRSRMHPESYVRTIIKKNVSVGANATILAGITIGVNSLIAAGSVVTKDVPLHAVEKGNPARVCGWIDPHNSKMVLKPRQIDTIEKGSFETGVPGANIYVLPRMSDERGSLCFAQTGQYLLFDAKRFFMIFDVPSDSVRGGHAHNTCHQSLVCLKGSCRVMIENKKRTVGNYT